MSVVVNEFEVVPEAEQPESGGQRDAVPDQPSFDIEREVRRVLEFERARDARLHAC